MTIIYEITVPENMHDFRDTIKFEDLDSAIDYLVLITFNCREFKLNKTLAKRFRRILAKGRVYETVASCLDYVAEQVYDDSTYSCFTRQMENEEKIHFQLELDECKERFVVSSVWRHQWSPLNKSLENNSVLLKRLNYLWSEFKNGKDMVLDLR